MSPSRHTIIVLVSMLGVTMLGLAGCAFSSQRATMSPAVQHDDHGALVRSEESAQRPVQGVPTGSAAAASLPSPPGSAVEVQESVEPELLAGTADDVIPAVVQAAAGQAILRVRLVRAAGKYPLRRQEEVLTRGPHGVTVASLREMVADHLLVSLDPARPAAFADLAAATGCSVRRVLPGGRTALLAFPYLQHADYEVFRQRLAAQPGIRVAESDWIAHAIGTPDDTSFGQLWGMHNAADTDIDAPEAWDIHTGSKAVLVGVIDTGIDASHPDLAANMWQNPGESGSDAQGNPKQSNGLDDDGNGYVDDFRGWDFVNNDNDPNDDHYHGTHCAGTIGASGNNGGGVAGVCWNVSMVGLKFLSASGSGAISDAVEAQLYANAIGCTLTSNSWGGGGFSQAMKDAIDAAGSQGILFVAAAGNSAANNDLTPHYPSSYDSTNVIAVAATDVADAMASFSCYGATSVDLGAPGVAVYSCQPGGLYQNLSGTSMATPHVAGACALLKSANPSLTGAQIKQAILDNTDPVPALAGKTLTGGRLNLHRALVMVSGPVVSTAAIAVAEAGNGDGLLNPGEQAVVTVTLASVGSEAVPGLVGVLGCGDPAVIIEHGTVVYGDLAQGQSSPGDAPFRIRLAAGVPTPHAVNLVLSATSGSTLWTFPLTVTYVTTTQISGLVTRAGTGSPIAGATVAWTGPQAGSTLSDAAGAYLAIVPDGTYQLAASAPGLNPGLPVGVSVPPAAQVDLTLGAAALVVTPSSVALTSESPTSAVLISNPGDATLTYTAALPTQAVTSGLWHASGYRTAGGSGTAWYYGDETKRNYETGARNSGALAFPAVLVPAADPTLRFASWRSTESGTVFDVCLVQVSTDGGLSWVTINAPSPNSTIRRDGLASDAAAPDATWTTVRQETDVSATWTMASASLAAYSGQTIGLRFWFDTVDSIANVAEGWYVDDISVGGGGLDAWLTAAPPTGSVPPGGSATVQLTALPGAVLPGIYDAVVTVSSNAPVDGSASVAVTFTKTALPELTLVGIVASDAGAPALGDADGTIEPGETVTILPTWSNLGTVAAIDVTTSIASTSPYVQIIGASAALPAIPGGSQAAASAPFVVGILPTCPNGTTIALTLTAVSPSGITWNGSASMLVKWSSRLSGVVRNGQGAPVAGATVAAGTFSTLSAADGSYAISGLAAGTLTATASKAGAIPATQSFTTPPDVAWDPIVGTPSIALDPSSLALSAQFGQSAGATVTVSNPGDLPLTFAVAGTGGAPTATGLWHQSTYRTVGGQPSWYYGIESKRNYDTGASNSGALTFANVTIPAGSPTLAWQQWRRTESAGTTYDVSRIQVSSNGTAWTTVHQTILNDSLWNQVSTSLAAYAGQTVQIRFWFDTVDAGANAYEGWYVSDIRLNGAGLGTSWLSVSPGSGTVAPGDSTQVTVVADAAALTGGIYSAALSFTSNAPAQPILTLPVAFTVITPPSLAAGLPVISDSGVAPVSGDGDGKAEPGETIAWSIPVLNSGTLPAEGVQATLSSTSPHVSFPTATISYGTIAGLATGNAAAPFHIAIAPTCPSNTSVPITCTFTSISGGPWSASLSLLVKWDCRVQGWVTEVGTGAKIAGATISCSGLSATTDANGNYLLTGLPAGTLSITVSKTGYAALTSSVTVPPNAWFIPVIGIRDLSVSPTSLQQTVPRGQTVSIPITFTGTGSIEATWSFSGLPSWITVTPSSGLVFPGGTATATMTLNGAAVGNGVYSAYSYVYTNATRNGTTRPISVGMTVRSANPPTAAPVEVAMQEDGVSAIQLLGSDADADPLIYTIVTQPAHGTVTLGSNGLATYRPTALYHGSDSFTYRVSDGFDLSAPATVSISIAHVNHGPTTWPTVIHAAPGATTTFALPTKDVDLDPLTAACDGPLIGTLVCTGTQASYTPPAGFAGQDVFTFTVSDGQLSSPAAQVIISVTTEPIGGSWPTLGNGPEHLGAVERQLGSLTMVPDWTATFGFPIHQVAVDGGVYYTSRTYNGVMRIGALDPSSGVELWRRDLAAASTLNPPTVHEGSVYLQRGNHSSDSQVWRLDAATGNVVWQAPYQEQWPHHLAPTVDGNRVWINGGYYGGIYGFARDTGAQAFFLTKPQYDMWTPTLSGNVVYAWAGNVLAAHEPQGGGVQWSLTLPVGAQAYSQNGTAIADAQHIYAIAGSYSSGTLYAVDLATHQIAWSRSGTYRGMPALQGGKLFAYTAAGIEQLDAVSGATQLTYLLAGLAPGTGASVQPIVTQDAVIGASASSTALFARDQTVARQTVPYGGHLSLAGMRLYIAGNDLRTYRIGNRAPVAFARSAETIQEEQVTLALWGNDPDDQLLSWSIVDEPAHGGWAIGGGLLTYYPAAGFAGVDTLSVVASDGSLSSEPVTVTITVAPRPVAQALQVTVRHGQPVAVVLQASNPRGLPLTFQVMASPANGALAGDPPAVVYTSIDSFTGDDTFTYTASDGVTTSLPATVTVTVTPDLPASWTGQDIGAADVAGLTYQDPVTGMITSSGSGNGPVGTADSGQIATTAVNGDFDVVARIPLPPTTSAAARVGVIVRETTDPGSRGVFLGLSGAKKTVWSRRTAINGSTSTSSWTVAGATWMKITRRGNVLWGYRSADGVTWTSCGNVTIALPSQLRVGTLVASGVAGTALSAQLTGFAIALPTPAAPEAIAINFQAGKDAPVQLAGTTWLIADGSPFAARWAGIDYGFSAVSTSTYNRNSTLSLDELYDTGINPATSNIFEIAVPNGNYTVTICVGDANGTSGKVYPEVEGVRAVTGVFTTTTRWFTSTVDAEVTDGRLTLRCGTGASTARWSWVQIAKPPVAVPGDG